MKRIIFSIAFIASISLTSLSGSAQTSADAAKYMTELLKPFSELKDETWQYLKAVTKGKGARKVDSKRINLINELNSAKNTIKSKKGYNGDESLKNSVSEYLSLSYIVLKEDFDKILDMEEIAEQSYDNMEAYLLAKEKANEKLNTAGDKVQESQKAFAEKHDIELIEEEDKTTQKINKASDALKYYNELYLIFFKCYKQEMYVLEALNKSDINGMEQNINSLKTFADEGLEKIKELKAHNGDGSVKVALRQILMFYKNEAENDFAGISDFYLKKDNFEKVNKVLESKKKKDRTQADVDKYNKASQEYNNAVTKFNKINSTANEKRAKQLNDWNKVIDAFFAKHAG